MKILCCITRHCNDENGRLSADMANEFIRECRDVIPKDKDGRDIYFMEQYRMSVQNFNTVLVTDDDDDNNEEAEIEDIMARTEEDLAHCLPCYSPERAYKDLVDGS